MWAYQRKPGWSIPHVQSNDLPKTSKDPSRIPPRFTQTPPRPRNPLRRHACFWDVWALHDVQTEGTLKASYLYLYLPDRRWSWYVMVIPMIPKKNLPANDLKTLTPEWNCQNFKCMILSVWLINCTMNIQWTWYHPHLCCALPVRDKYLLSNAGQFFVIPQPLQLPLPRPDQTPPEGRTWWTATRTFQLHIASAKTLAGICS